MKKLINDKQLQTIKYELNYYSNYCDQLLKEKIQTKLHETSDHEIIDTIFNLKRNELNDLLLYFYLHSDEEGNIISLNHSILKNEFVSSNKETFIEIDELFLNNLFKNKTPLYFLDVDNTLTDQGFLSNEKIEFISNFKYKENIILSTGKVSDAIMNVINDCKLNDNYYSCLNGSVIHKKEKYQIINGIGEVSEHIINSLMDKDVTFIFYYHDHIEVNKPLLQKDIDNLNKFNEKFYPCKNAINYKEIVKVLAFIDDNKTKEQEIKENIVREVTKDYNDLHCVRTAPHTFEVLRKDQHKGNSVRKIAELMGVYYRQSIGVGDSMNDFPMLEYIGRPFVVSNVSDELRSYNFEILKDNRNIDIVNIIKKFEV